MAEWVRVNRPDIEWWCPQLPPSPREAMDMILARVQAWPAATAAVIGSSLGGFYACHVAEQTGCRAVLLNPAVNPARDLARYIGEITAWHSDERFYFRAAFIDELRALASSALNRPERYLAIIAKGDEVLDWREMSAFCAGCQIKLLDGSDHGLTDFDDHLPDVIDFLQLAPTQGQVTMV